MRIFLIRHGESVANLDRSNYAAYHDALVPLTQLGQEQAQEAGKALQQFWEKHPELKGQKTRLYFSPMLRTKQTTDALLQGFDSASTIEKRENHLIREHDKGLAFLHSTDEAFAEHFPHENALYKKLYKDATKAYLTLPMGESGLNVTDRMHMFKNEIMRAYAKGIDNFIVVSHMKSIQCLEMDFFHHPVDWLNNVACPENCEIIKFEGEPGKGNFTRESIHISTQRPEHAPKDYKAAPVGEAKTTSRAA